MTIKSPHLLSNSLSNDLQFFSGSHIRPNFHDRSCLDDPLAKLKREIELAMEEIKQREREHIKVPSKWKNILSSILIDVI